MRGQQKQANRLWVIVSENIPDGEKVVYVAYPPDYDGVDMTQLEVFIANKDGSNEIQLTDDDIRDHDPYWSPDGNTIAFESMTNGVLQWAIRTVEVDGTNLTSVLDDGDINTVPRWTKDSNTFYFFRLDYEQVMQGWNIWKMNVDGSNLEQITTEGGMNPELY